MERYEELGLVKVPAGEFLMGSADEDQYAGGSEKPQHTLYLSAFYIGKYPVTVAQYRSFIQESQYKTSDENSTKGIENHPVVNVSWEDAIQFSQWHGMTLPSEAQWEKAARGTDGRIYPWRSKWENRLANTAEYWNSGARGLWSKLRRRSLGTTTPIGYFSPRGDSPHKCADMIGNVWEWTSTIYKEYPYRLDDGRDDIKASGPRVLRGGSFSNLLRSTRCADRGGYDPYGIYWTYGFRVCVSPIIKSEL